MAKTIRFFYEWLFKRLPLSFSVPWLAALILYFTLLFPILIRFTIKLIRFDSVSLGIFGWKSFVFSILSLFFALLGIIICYGIVGTGYSFWRKRTIEFLKIHPPAADIKSVDQKPGAGRSLKRFKRIGIILSGGGAKGAYQAGAMKAIYEFLKDNNALDKVSMISGTSIGAWNSLFWLGGLIGKKGKSKSLHEQWWKNISIQNTIKPAFYLPLNQNYFLSPKPWKETFNAIFLNNKKISRKLSGLLKPSDNNGGLHFYITRSNVKKGHIEFTTNNRKISRVNENLKSDNRTRGPVSADKFKISESIEDIREAVFASMDIPPLFKYTKIDNEHFEDGGVLENLPIRFGTEIEKCDLLFVLPLNANFEEEVNFRSILRRLYRVMESRQGALERNSFKMIYLYNELAELRKREHNLEKNFQKFYNLMEDNNSIGAEDMEAVFNKRELELIDNILKKDKKEVESDLDRALKRKHKSVKIFSICPGPQLIINTMEFWKKKEAERSFEIMYQSTLKELDKFDFSSNQDWIKMGLVNPDGEVSYFSDF